MKPRKFATRQKRVAVCRDWRWRNATYRREKRESQARCDRNDRGRRSCLRRTGKKKVSVSATDGKDGERAHSSTLERAVDGSQVRIVETLLSRPKASIVLIGDRGQQSFATQVTIQPHHNCHTIVSGYSMWQTLIPLISSGDKRPNCISSIVRSGALECSKSSTMIADVCRDRLF